jgi:predicted ABC-type transport system involved in lysophospholipase L1 biosynthesis ATPase subunit
MAGNQNSGRRNMPPGPGRPKGCKNKIPSDLRGDLFTAYQKKGGQKWLEKLTDDQFLKMLLKIIPQEISGNEDADFDMAEALKAARERLIAEGKL